MKAPKEKKVFFFGRAGCSAYNCVIKPVSFVEWRLLHKYHGLFYMSGLNNKMYKVEYVRVQ